VLLHWSQQQQMPLPIHAEPKALRPVQGSSSVLPVYSFVFVVFGRRGGIRVARVRARSTRTRRAQRRRGCARNGPRVRNLPQRGPVPQP
jgi:hypothetical protein